MATDVVVLQLLPIGSMPKHTGAEGIRTPDPHNAIVVLYQLSYDPIEVVECRLRGRVCNSEPGFVARYAETAHS